MGSVEKDLDPEILQRIGDLYEVEEQVLYPVTETQPSDKNHPQIRFIPYDLGAAVVDELLDHGYDLPNYLLQARYKKAAARVIRNSRIEDSHRQSEAHRINAMLGL